MKYKVEKDDADVVIRFDDVGADAQVVMDAIGRCRFHAWECTTGECLKIGSMSPSGEGRTLCLRVRPKQDEVLDVASLSECLKYQLPRFISSKK